MWTTNIVIVSQNLLRRGGCRYTGREGGWSPALTVNKLVLSLRSMLASNTDKVRTARVQTSEGIRALGPILEEASGHFQVFPNVHYVKVAKRSGLSASRAGRQAASSLQ